MELEARGIAEVRATGKGLIATLLQWPFPLWSLAQPAQDGSAQQQQMQELHRERKIQLEAIRETERVREPSITISDAKVHELHEAHVAYARDRSRHESKFAVRQPAGFHIMHPAIPGYDEEQSASYQALKRLWQELSEGERIEFTALAIFTRGEVADWAYSYDRAEWIVANNDQRYQIHLGNDWLPGLRRYRAEPPRRT